MEADCTAEDLVSACLAKRWLTGSAAKKVAWLIDCGLDPEQALIGTGLLSPEKFLEISGQKELKSSNRSRPTSDQPELSVRSLAKVLVDAINENQAEQLKLHESRRTVTAFLDTDPYEAFFEFPAAYLSSLILRLQRSQLKDGWQLTRESLADGELVMLQRVEAGHGPVLPLKWMWQLKSFAQTPEGMLALIGADHRVLAKVSEMHFPVISVAPSDQETEEQVMHAALMGDPMVVQLDEERSWLDELAQTGVPVRVVKCHATSDGCQYEAYKY